MLRQINLGVQDGAVTKYRVLPPFIFLKFNFTIRSSYKYLIDVRTTQMFIFILLESAPFLFESAFFQ